MAKDVAELPSIPPSAINLNIKILKGVSHCLHCVSLPSVLHCLLGSFFFCLYYIACLARFSSVCITLLAWLVFLLSVLQRLLGLFFFCLYYIACLACFSSVCITVLAWLVFLLSLLHCLLGSFFFCLYYIACLACFSSVHITVLACLVFLFFLYRSACLPHILLLVLRCLFFLCFYPLFFCFFKHLFAQCFSISLMVLKFLSTELCPHTHKKLHIEGWNPEFLEN